MKIITTLLDNDFLSIEYLAELEMLKIVWKQESATMNEEGFKVQIHHLLENVLLYTPPYILANTTNMQYTITPKLQEWNNNLAFPIFKQVKVKKLAFIISEDIFTRVSIEQTFDDSLESGLITSYFDKEETALDWLFE